MNFVIRTLLISLLAFSGLHETHAATRPAAPSGVKRVRSFTLDGNGRVIEVPTEEKAAKKQRTTSITAHPLSLGERNLEGSDTDTNADKHGWNNSISHTNWDNVVSHTNFETNNDGGETKASSDFSGDSKRSSPMAPPVSLSSVPAATGAIVPSVTSLSSLPAPAVVTPVPAAHTPITATTPTEEPTPVDTRADGEYQSAFDQEDLQDTKEEKDGKAGDKTEDKTGNQDLSLILKTQKNSALIYLPAVIFNNIMKFLSHGHPFNPRLDASWNISGLRESSRAGKLLADVYTVERMRSNFLEAYSAPFGYGMTDNGYIAPLDRLERMHKLAVSLNFTVSVEYSLLGIAFPNYVISVFKAACSGNKALQDIYEKLAAVGKTGDVIAIKTVLLNLRNDLLQTSDGIKTILDLAQNLVAHICSQDTIKRDLEIVRDNLVTSMTSHLPPVGSNKDSDKERVRIGKLVDSVCGLIESAMVSLFCNDDFRSLVKLLMDNQEIIVKHIRYQFDDLNNPDPGPAPAELEAELERLSKKVESRVGQLGYDLRILAVLRIPNLCIQAIQSGNTGFIDRLSHLYEEHVAVGLGKGIGGLNIQILNYCLTTEANIFDDTPLSVLSEKNRHMINFCRSTITNIIKTNPAARGPLNELIDSVCRGSIGQSSSLKALLLSGLLKNPDPKMVKLCSAKVFCAIFRAAITAKNPELIDLCLSRLARYCQDLDDLDDQIIPLYNQWHEGLNRFTIDLIFLINSAPHLHDGWNLDSRRFPIPAHALEALFTHGEAFALDGFLSKNKIFTRSQLVAMLNAAKKRAESDEDFIDIQNKLEKRINKLGKKLEQEIGPRKMSFRPAKRTSR